MSSCLDGNVTIGLVMSHFKERYAGQYDGGVLGRVVRDEVELSVSLERAVKDRKTLEALTSNLDALIYILSELKQTEDQSNDFSGFFREDEDE